MHTVLLGSLLQHNHHCRQEDRCSPVNPNSGRETCQACINGLSTQMRFAASCSKVPHGHSRPGSWQRSPLRLSQSVLILTAVLGPMPLHLQAARARPPCCLQGRVLRNWSTSKQQDPDACEGSAGQGSLKLTMCLDELAPKQGLLLRTA